MKRAIHIVKMQSGKLFPTETKYRRWVSIDSKNLSTEVKCKMCTVKTINATWAL